MSRIHEALKKAELERTSGSLLTSLRASAQQTTATPEIEDPAKISPINLTVAADTPGQGLSLRFEDIRDNCAHVKWNPDPLKDVFANTEIGSEAAEQFRTLRSRLHQLQQERPLRVILVTSALSGDGKTFIATNLAQAIVRQTDRRVLLIDADLRSSILHVHLGGPATPGLAEYLAGDAQESTVIQHGQEGGLYFIAGGRPVNNPSELLSSLRLKTLIERAAPCFDWVIIDSPPCLPVSDAGVIAQFCDGIVLIVRSGDTPLSAAHRAYNELRNRNVIGVVLNAVDEKALAYGSYYARGQYGQPIGSSAQLNKEREWQI